MKITKQLLLNAHTNGWWIRSISEYYYHVGCVDDDGDIRNSFCDIKYGTIPVCIIN